MLTADILLCNIRILRHNPFLTIFDNKLNLEIRGDDGVNADITEVVVTAAVTAIISEDVVVVVVAFDEDVVDSLAV